MLCCISVTAARPGLLHAWILLTDCYSKLRIYNEAVNSALKARKLILQVNVNKALEKYLNVLYSEAVSHSNDIENLMEIIQICENVSSTRTYFVRWLLLSIKSDYCI